MKGQRALRITQLSSHFYSHFRFYFFVNLYGVVSIPLNNFYSISLVHPQGWTKEFPDEPAFVVPASLRKKVAAGHFGRKSGHGYYTWDGDKPIAPSEEPLL
jgi:3-hydroxyacyl-CoA dehydrogenase